MKEFIEKTAERAKMFSRSIHPRDRGTTWDITHSFEIVINCRKEEFVLLLQQTTYTLHLESRSVMCHGAKEKQAHRCDPYGLRVQEQPLFLVCSRIAFLLLSIKSHRSKNIYAGADQK